MFNLGSSLKYNFPKCYFNRSRVGLRNYQGTHKLPIEMAYRPHFEKHSRNATFIFERLSQEYDLYLVPGSWQCSG